MQDFLAYELYAGITVEHLGIVFLATLGGLIVGLIADAAVRRGVDRLPEHSIRRAVLGALNGPLRWLVMVACGLLAFDVISNDTDIREVEARIFIVFALPFALWFGLRLVDGAGKVWLFKAEKTDSNFDDQLVPVVVALCKVALWIVAVLLLVQNLGGEVGSLLAGFGLGGLAVAMASKDTLANLFGSVVIFIDRPFTVGDWVEIAGQEGVVEEVGLRVTRIRTFAKSLITIPNSRLTTEAINNWSRMPRRRIKLTVGVTYDATPEQLEEAVQGIREILRKHDHVDQEFWMVNLDAFGASSLDIFVYCFSKDTEWEVYMETKQMLMLSIMRMLRTMGLEIAFPTRTVHIEGGVPEAMGRVAPGSRPV